MPFSTHLQPSVHINALISTRQYPGQHMSIPWSLAATYQKHPLLCVHIVVNNMPADLCQKHPGCYSCCWTLQQWAHVDILQCSALHLCCDTAVVCSQQYGIYGLNLAPSGSAFHVITSLHFGHFVQLAIGLWGGSCYCQQLQGAVPIHLHSTGPHQL